MTNAYFNFSKSMPILNFRRPALIAVLAGALACAGTGSAQAIPVELNAAQFAAQTAGLTSVVETFEGFTTGVKTSPLTLSNGSYNAPTPIISDIDIDFCGDTDKCLFDSSSIFPPRSFSAFPAGATFWGTDFHTILSTDIFQVTVMGLGGTSVFTHAATGGFWGFHDLAGLTSVSFVNLGGTFGTGNYSFDNVKTAVPNAAVPEPSALALVGLGLAGLRLARNKTGSRPTR